VATLALTASAAAFSAPALSARRATSLQAADMSAAIPFLKRPAKLDGSMVGDKGFDPMGLSDIQVDLNYARTAELKHGRICMLATTGFLWQEYYPHVGGSQFTETNPLTALTTVPLAGHLQILLVIGCVELSNFSATYGNGEPGDYGFDPLAFSKGKSKDELRRKQLAELENGRLAMVGFTGMVAQTMIFDKPLFADFDF